MTTPPKPDHEKRPFRFKLEGPFLCVSTMLLITPISPNFKGLKCSVFGRFRALQSRKIYGIVKLHPARGRKRIVRLCVNNQCDCNFSPQGDGNDVLHQSSGTILLQFIPARGRKRCTAVLMCLCSVLQFIPARGQKSTSATGVCQQRRCFAFSYILFYRLGTAPAGIVFVTGSALTPCGTFRFKGRIPCR